MKLALLAAAWLGGIFLGLRVDTGALPVLLLVLATMRGIKIRVTCDNLPFGLIKPIGTLGVPRFPYSSFRGCCSKPIVCPDLGLNILTSQI